MWLEKMLNLFKLNTNKTITKESIDNKNSCEDFFASLKYKKYTKDFPASIREWNNSIYAFNKNTLGLIPQANVLTMKIIRSYFSLYNLKIERKIRKKRLLRRLRRLSSHKIYVSNGEFKHTNDKVIITLYTYNRQKYNYILKMKKRYLRLFVRNKIKNRLKKRFYFIKYKGLNFLKKANKNKSILIKALNIIHRHNLYSSDHLTKFYKKIVKKSFKKLKLYFLYKQLIYINRSKFNYTYLNVLKKYIQNIYNKNVEFNLVNLKYHYFNSDILSESITLKIKRKRTKKIKILNKIKKKVKIDETNKYAYYEPMLNKMEKMKNPTNENYLKTVVLENVKYKRLAGVRLEASGRLTRRYTASRSISKLKYKGNLINIDSSYKGLSTVILKGNLRSNLQYTKLNSKTRIGSFGIKGWVSGS